MDSDMWKHTATQRNVTALREMGYTVLPPDEGELASGLIGPGRLPELNVIVETVDAVLEKSNQDLRGKNVVVTAGPTREAIDPVRYIGNRSSGKMGFAIANAAAQRGAKVTLISGPVALPTPRNVQRVDVESAEDMFRSTMKHRGKADIVVMSAAVADFTPEKPSATKIKKDRKNGTALSIELRKTKDILLELTKAKGKAIVVGFALETDHALANAKKKLKEKHADFIVMNNPTEEGAGFNTDTNIITILSKRGKIERLKKMPKFDAAHEILNRVVKIL
jgi:phosphopantothenoylcysteine decarboxylase/phosphopantothenate--cysteine ligase